MCSVVMTGCRGYAVEGPGLRVAATQGGVALGEGTRRPKVQGCELHSEHSRTGV